jgi:hypothetical protein
MADITTMMRRGPNVGALFAQAIASPPWDADSTRVRIAHRTSAERVHAAVTAYSRAGRW